MTITLEAIKAEQSKIAAMIAAFEQQPSYPISVPFPPLNEGEKFVGVVISADGSRRHYLILLSGEKANIKWQQAMEWAQSIGGELPDRVESALLFATMKDEFEPEWYWTREQLVSDAGFAWYQTFGSGYQLNLHKSFEGRARAVRRLAIQ
ncbi:MAG: hypothetical protein MOGMAGMI_02425 [Candidatus Omnitrophica bacterium]|nr:hypothetical protein [Candidatus Omnitrophota bacterium]